jgi:putative hemolysin
MALLLLSAFFSSVETAMTTINKIKLRNMVECGLPGAELAQKILGNPKKLLTSVLIGNNLVNIGASAMATSIAMEFISGRGAAVGAATGVITVIILIFGEITPKTISAQNPEKIALFFIKPVAFFVYIFTPLVLLFSLITNGIMRLTGNYRKDPVPVLTESEFRTMVNVSHDEGIIEHEERTMIHNVVVFGDRKASDVMIARTNMQGVPAGATLAEVKDLFWTEQFSRMPVYQESMDNIVGILYYKDIFKKNTRSSGFSIMNYAREPYFTYESKPLSQLFIKMRTERIPMAIVLDEYGGTAGLITIEDLVEKIVGRIYDEYDDENISVQKISDDEFLLDGSCRLADVNQAAGCNFESRDYDSIGGYVMGVMGRVPEPGEGCSEERGGFSVRFTVEEMIKNHIELVRLLILKSGEADEKREGEGDKNEAEDL